MGAGGALDAEKGEGSRRAGRGGGHRGGPGGEARNDTGVPVPASGLGALPRADTALTKR